MVNFCPSESFCTSSLNNCVWILFSCVTLYYNKALELFSCDFNNLRLNRIPIDSNSKDWKCMELTYSKILYKFLEHSSKIVIFGKIRVPTNSAKFNTSSIFAQIYSTVIQNRFPMEFRKILSQINICSVNIILLICLYSSVSRLFWGS